MEKENKLKELFTEHEEFDRDLFFVESRTLEDLIALWLEFLQNAEVDLEWIQKLAATKDEIDLNNNEFGYYSNGSDAVMERADSMVDVYYNELWLKAKDYQDFITEAVEEYGAEWCGITNWLERLFMVWQLKYYERLYANVLTTIENIIEAMRKED